LARYLQFFNDKLWNINVLYVHYLRIYKFWYTFHVVVASSYNWFEGIMSSIFVWSRQMLPKRRPQVETWVMHMWEQRWIHQAHHVSKQISSQENSTEMLRGYTSFVYSSVPGWFRADYSHISGELLDCDSDRRCISDNGWPMSPPPPSKYLVYSAGSIHHTRCG